MRTSLVLGLALAATATAQTPNPSPRAKEIISSTLAPITVGDSLRVAAPQELLPADPALNLASTNNVVYAIFPDVEQNPQNPLLSQPGIAFRRSINGGVSFEAATFPFLGPISTAGLDADLLHLKASGHNVWISFVSTLADPTNPASSDGVKRPYVAASQDQGQTWQIIPVSVGIDAPLSTGDRLSDTEFGTGFDVSGNRAFVSFYPQYSDTAGNQLGFAVGIGGPTGGDQAYFQAVEFDATGTLVRVFPEERYLEAVPTGSADSDEGYLACDGPNVTITWRTDQGTGNSTGNHTFSTTSLDGGISFAPPVDHFILAGINGIAGSIDQISGVDVRGLEIIVTAEFNVSGGFAGGFADQAHFSYSDDGGQTWAAAMQLGYNSTGDLDRHRVAFVGTDSVFFAAEDQEIAGGSGSGVNDDEIAVQVSTVTDLIAGNTTPIIVSAVGAVGGGIELYTIAVSGDVLAVCFEEEAFDQEGWSYAVSTDLGQNWTRFDADFDGLGDVDDGDIAITLNRSVSTIFVEDNLGANVAYIAGVKAPYLVDDSTVTNSIQAVDANPGDLMLLLVSENTSAQPFNLPPVINTEPGVQYAFTPGQVTIDTLGFPSFISFVDTNGNATFPFLQFAQVIGIDLAIMAASIDTTTGDWTNRYTDQIIQKP